MWSKFVNLKHAVAAVGMSVLLVGTAFADARQDALLEILRIAPKAEALNAARDLERSWGASGSAAMDLLLRRGRDALEVGNFPLAIEHFTALTDHAPDFAEGFHARATAYFQAELFGPALADLERALALNPDNYMAIFGLGVILGEIGDKQKAALLFRKALEIHPHMEQARDALNLLKRDGIGREL